MNDPTCRIWNEDCILAMAERLTDESVHLTITSIPFEELFTYSGKLEDVGNNGSTIDIRAGRFALNMRFVAAQLLRVHAAGTNACIHIQQLLAYRNQHGFSGRRDFRGAMIDVFGAAGWQFVGEAAIPKDQQAMAQRLSLHSLQFKTGHSRTATDWAMAPNDYVLVFQKPGDAVVPVRPLVYHPRNKPTPRLTWFKRNGVNDAGYVEYLREWAKTVDAINPAGWLSADDWIAWASGIWADVNEFDVLNGARAKSNKEGKHEKHVCPLQLEVIRRCVLMYSNPITVQPDSLVLDPFMGIGSSAFVALGGKSPMTKMGVDSPRNVVGFELKESYHRAAVDNAAKALEDRPAKTLMDLADIA